MTPSKLLQHRPPSYIGCIYRGGMFPGAVWRNLKPSNILHHQLNSLIVCVYACVFKDYTFTVIHKGCACFSWRSLKESEKTATQLPLPLLHSLLVFVSSKVAIINNTIANFSRPKLASFLFKIPPLIKPPMGKEKEKESHQQETLKAPRP